RAHMSTDVPVAVAQLDAVYGPIKWGPTAMNILPLRLLVLRRGEPRERLVPLMSEGNRDRVAAAPRTLLLGHDSNFHQHVGTLFPHAPHVQDQLSQATEVREPMARTTAMNMTG